MKKKNNLYSFIRLILFQWLVVNLLSTLIITLTTNIQRSFARNVIKDFSLSTVEIIRNNGYVVETHYVTTEDGYILELHRIPKNKNGQKPTKNYPVIFQHSFLSTSAEWVVTGPNNSLSLQLVDAGYDVWLTNCRGNTYSRKHVSMTYKQKAYWKFSIHEIGKFDLPAAFDYILMKTNASQFHYIGYSMGTCVFFIMASERPEYQSKIRSQISLAPVVYLSNTRSPIRYLAPYANMIDTVTQKLWNGMVFSHSWMTTVFGATVCRGRLTQKLICLNSILFFICGKDPFYFDTKLTPFLMGHFPSGTSSMTVKHFAQLILKDSFSKFDYGPTMNLKHYNATEPPTYNLKSIQVPITLITGKTDLLTDAKDLTKLKNQLPKLMDVISVNSTYFNHLDFLCSTRVNELINDPVKEILQKTDDINWKYSGPNLSATQEISDLQEINTTSKQTSLDEHELESSMDYLKENLDTIIAKTMNWTVDNNVAKKFKREQKLQTLLFGDHIKLFKSAEKVHDKHKNSQFKDNLTEKHISTFYGRVDTRNVMEMYPKKISDLVNEYVESENNDSYKIDRNVENAIKIDNSNKQTV